MSPEPISMDLGSLRKEGVLVWKAWCRIGLPEEKDKFSGNLYPTIFCCNKDLISAMLPMYYGISSSTLCQMSGLRLIIKNINKLQTAFKLEFQEHASDWPQEKVTFQPSYVYVFSCNRYLCRTMLPIYLQNFGDIFLNSLPSLSHG